MKVLIFFVIEFFTIFIPVLLSVAFLTLIERKVMGSMQSRRGPNVVGFFGLLQPISDGVKLLFKEPIIPYKSSLVLFVLSPILTFALSLINWSFVVLSPNSIFINVDLTVLFLLAVSSLSVYGVILAGWSSNSKYAFLGGLRSAAQMISYEVSLSLTILPVIILSGSLNLIDIVESQKYVWFVFLIFPISLCFMISILAETNRAPFDLPEAEGELVAGFNVEYSAFSFAMFFLAEYSNIILMSVLFVLYFLGGWYLFGLSSSLIVLLKLCFVLYFFVWVRASLPRYRYDQLMQLGWKVILPFSMAYFLFVSSVFFSIVSDTTGVW